MRETSDGLRKAVRYTFIMKIFIIALAVLITVAMVSQAANLQPKKQHHRGPHTFKKTANNSSHLSQMWSDCGSSDDLVKILSVSITPDPPEKGQKVYADLQLEFLEEVEGGSLTILIKYRNWFPVVNKKKNLCNIPDILADSCPLQPGVHEATLAKNFPSVAPSGTYSGKVVAKDKNGNQLMCLKLYFKI